ncbi:hypothetical protein CDO87_14280 [Sagittula sp. P11]|uniref:hypothetical protein n=1 Tax=Sagittula sp. P11 TaxID=2009329 RepID=UPI000C2D2758|nr:hypothetical protein [Sagittula sp. P11]AUC54272.1 hypothetical protein CDO87_14280 [Sagittula sp. P11]
MADRFIAKADDGYVIKDRGTGKVVSRHGSIAAAAAVLREAVKQETRKQRPCITCGTLFWSEGAHNRMCDPCRTRSQEAPYQIGHRRGRIGARV